MKKRWIVLTALLAALVIGAGALNAMGYDAQEQARAAMISSEGVEVRPLKGGETAFVPQAAEKGLIFYPGGLVEHTAYAPLMEALAQEGWLCVLTQMPLELAVLDMNAADGLQEQFPEVDSWAIGGHSLGGAMAASYAAGHAEDFDALVLLAAYSTADLTSSGLDVISLYGSEDGVLNREKYADYRKNLPDDAREIIIEGGNHAGFGDYGPQRGDGSASISPQEQIRRTVSELTKE